MSGQDPPPRRASPWLVSPLLSVDPKLGRNLGGMAAYLHRFDDASPVSMVGVGATYSNTDSLVGGLFGDLYWGQARGRCLASCSYCFWLWLCLLFILFGWFWLRWQFSSWDYNWLVLSFRSQFWGC